MSLIGFICVYLVNFCCVILIRRVNGSVVDPDPYVFGPPGPGSIIICADPDPKKKLISKKNLKVPVENSGNRIRTKLYGSTTLGLTDKISSAWPSFLLTEKI